MLQNMMNSITDLGNQIRAARAKLAEDSRDPAITMDALKAAQAQINEMEERMQMMQDNYNALVNERQGGLTNAAPKAQETPRSVREMRASNEYARAFMYALSAGKNRRNGRGDENMKILYDALTETGGATPGEDGGFLVPIDMDNQIREFRRTLNPLADYFGGESVTAPTGWRVTAADPTAGMSEVNEMATVPTNDQPEFAKITYSLKKYGLRLPVSHELIADNAANLMGYLSKWFAIKEVLTENALILACLKTLVASALTPSKQGANPIQGLKSVLNKGLDPAISMSAIILCNQTAFDELDQIEDEHGRGLLQPDPTNATIKRAFGRPVVMVSDATMPNITGSPNTTDLFIGDGHQFATLFKKDGYEVASTDIGGNAWATDSTEIRGIVRMGISKFDTAAMVRRNISLS